MVRRPTAWRPVGLAALMPIGALTGAVAGLLLGAAPASADCGRLLPDPVASGPMRAIIPDDLVRLRDIGYPDPLLMGGPSPLALSPDGTRVAFVLNRADPATNSYCRALVTVSLQPGNAPRVIDRGGELITVTDVQRGMFVRGGFPALITPVWSPDGRWVAYLKREHGLTQAWRVRDDSAVAEPVTHALADVERVAWSADGHSLLFATRPAKASIAAAVERESASGWLYDARIVTFSGPRPQIRAAEAPLAAFAVDIATGTSRSSSPAEAAAVGVAGAVSATAELAALTPSGTRAWVEMHGLTGTSTLRVANPAGVAIPCAEAACHDGIIGLWWSADGRELRFLRRQGWNKGQMALYRWRPGNGDPRPVFVTRDALIGCVAAGDRLVCTRENSTMPRRVVLIDVVTGRSDLLFDPNPEFTHIALGRVERLEWRNDRGLEAWGDLVLPPGYRRGDKVPLVVVQYSSRGFLRGGTADEFPIFAFAQHGIAVLSFEKPPFVATLDPAVKDWTAFNAANTKDWADRRSLLSAIETGVRMVIDRGIADPKRIGITGLSDGATTARFALINSRLFSAASISNCCLEPWTVNTYGGIAYADYVHSLGYPSLIHPDPDFWGAMSIAQNAARIDTPLLMQLNDDDGYILALEAYESLREHGKPVEMYVFPGEYHAKWQPAHRLAIYTRNLDWFDFWLRGVEDRDSAKSPQYARWRAMRARLATVPSRSSVSH